ncbi:MAG: DUF4314 domain-containing protein [Clostridiales bacterium]|nr:DUF4314 domain-containing protein [Clostridiales bacterium]
MNFPNRETVERLRRQYPEGTRVELVRMDDVQAPPAGTKGTVVGVDDTGSLIMRWDNGSSLNVVYGEDIVRRLPGLCDTVKKQILVVRDTGRANMFDTNAVKSIALEMGFYELADFLETERQAYSRFILTGEE